MSALIYSALALSGSTLLTILSLVGLASWSRQIVKVVPTAPALLTLNNDVIRASRQPQVRQRCEVVKEVEGEQSPGQGDGAALNVAQWVVRSVPSLSGTFKPSWWLPKYASVFSHPSSVKGTARRSADASLLITTDTQCPFTNHLFRHWQFHPSRSSHVQPNLPARSGRRHARARLYAARQGYAG